MSERKDGDATAQPGDPPRRFHMDKTEEVADAQERYKRAPAPAPAPATAVADRPTPAAASPAARAEPPAEAPAVDRRELQLARLATAGAALAIAIAFFYPAVHDALDRERRFMPLARDGRAVPPAPVPRIYLLVNATPRGATVTLDGVEAGNTPLATNVECVDGAPLRVEIAAPGYAPHIATVPCRAGGRAEVSPALKRDGGKR